MGSSSVIGRCSIGGKMQKLYYIGEIMFFLGAALSFLWEFEVIGKKSGALIPITGCLFLTIGFALMKMYNIS